MNSENKAKKMVVKIMGKSINIKSTDSQEYVNKISNIINEKVLYLKEHNPYLNQFEAIVLASLYLADELEKTNQKIMNADKKITNQDIDRILQHLSTEEEKYDKLIENLSSIVDNRKKEMMNINNLIDKIETKTDTNKDNEIEALKEALKSKNLEINDIKNSFETKITELENKLKEKEAELLEEKENMCFDEQKDRKIKELEEILALRESEIKDYMDFFDEMENKNKSEYIYESDLED